jgi:transposase InsO family protein
MKESYSEIGLAQLCGLFGYSRQSYYKRQIRQDRQAFESAIILDLVRSIRMNIPRIGGKKLYFMLKDGLIGHQIKLGRDGFFALLGAHNLLIKCRKRRAQTTWSKHGLRIYPDLTQGLNPLIANVLWVSDITYIRVGEIWNYVIFITDVYSHKVVGYHVADHMRAEFCEVALDQALAQWQNRLQPLIHHSDRGLQYCSALYTNKLKSNEIQISMTQHGDPHENAVAERVNGIFKTDFIMDQTFENLEQAKARIQNMVYHYNHTRPHLSCDMLTPAQAYEQQGPLPKRWK